MKCKATSLIVITISLLIMSGTLIAEEYMITQKELKFSPAIKVVKPGDRITFKNADTVVHNIVSLTPEFEFNLGKFKPGMTKTLKFNKLGVVDVECTIHPNMNMTIFIF